MNIPVRWMSVLVATLLSACTAKVEHEHGGAEHAEHGDEHEGHHEEGAGEAHRGEENVVRVERGMLRDLRVTTQAAESRPAGETVAVLGELRIDEDAYAEIGTSVAARVSRVLAAPGDDVRAGQALVELDSPEVGRARASLATAKARLELARQTVERRRKLAADQIVPQREMQAAEAELASAEAEARAAETALSAFGAGEAGTGSRIVLTSPIAGTVVDRTALRGRMVDPDHPLFVVGELRRLWLVVHAFERDALRMHPGGRARVTFPALPGQTVTGTVAKIGSRVDPSSRTLDVRIDVDNPRRVLRPGMSATALVPLGDAVGNVVAVPIESVQRREQGWCVFIPREEEGTFEIRPIGRGRDLSGEVEIVSGLRAGERVVVDGAFLLKAEADKARGGGEDEHHHH